MRLAETLLYGIAVMLQLATIVYVARELRGKRHTRAWQLFFAALIAMLAFRVTAMTPGSTKMPWFSLFGAATSFVVSALLIGATFSIRQLTRAADISEQMYRSIGESIDYGVWVCDADGKNIYASPSFLALVGMTQQQCSTLGWVDVLHPDDATGTLAAWKECVGSGCNWYREHRFKGVDGAWHPLLACGVPVRDASGKIVQWAGINLDIRRIKESEDRERIARTQAERQSRMKDEFLATVSHELRTPLNAIVGWSQLLQQGNVKPGDVQHALDVIDRNARAQVRLIEDLLDMSRIISGKVRLDVQSIMPAHVIDNAIDAVSSSADAKGIRIRKVLDPLAGPITADASRLQQAVWNLLTNAVKFTPKGGDIEVLLERINSHVEITVTDNGEGISADFLPFLFERFRQVDSSTRRQHQGLGIGLALVKNLVELHGGQVVARSDGDGCGSTFTISLPLRATESVKDGRSHPVTQSQGTLMPKGKAQLKDVRVLVVDDDADARELVGRLLSEYAAVVTLAASAAEAKSVIRENKIDVIISDIGMPGEDGFEFMQSIRKAGVRTPAVALTAFARSEDRMRALLAGFQIHLSKPVEPAEVVAVVESLSGRLRQQST